MQQELESNAGRAIGLGYTAEQLNEDFLREAFAILGAVKFKYNMKVWCIAHSQYCFAFPPRSSMLPKALHIEVAGTTCVAHCAIGGHAKWIHPSVLA